MTKRMQTRLLAKPDTKHRSLYDKEMQASLGRKDRNMGGWLSSQKYKAGTYAGTKAYSVGKGFKTDSFDGGDKSSRMGRQTFDGTDKTSPMANDSFDTDASRFASKEARDGGQTFRESGSQFDTFANRAALKSQQKNDKPKFIELEENAKGPAYSEDQVRKLMGR